MDFLRKLSDRFKRMFIVGLKQLQDPYYQGFAAQISFYLLLSIVPIFLLIIQVLGLFDISMQTAISAIQQYTGTRVSGLMNSLFEFSYIGYGNLIFVIIAFWAGSRASFAIARITNYIYTEGSNTGKKWLLERVRAVLTNLLTLVALVFAIIILCYGKIILISVLNVLRIDAAPYVDSVWLWLRWPLGFVLYFLVLGFNYYILPAKRRPFRRVVPGTFFAALGMVVVSWGYSFYTNSLVHYDIMYGALSSVVAIMIWFLLLSWVIILGVLCNKVFEDTSKPFTKREPVQYPDGGRWKPSKFDMDPKDIDMGAIMDVFTGNMSGNNEDKSDGAAEQINIDNERTDESDDD